MPALRPSLLNFCSGLLSLCLLLSPPAMANSKESGSLRGKTIVDMTTVTTKAWQDQLIALGSVYAREQITISSRVDGIIDQLNIHDGQKVESNQPLISLDSRFQQAKLAEAQAKLIEDERRLHELQQLESKRAVSQSDLDMQKATVNQSKAAVNAAQATLSFYALKAPFSGILGLSQLSKGQYIRPGDELVSLTNLESLYIDLNLPSKYMSQIQLDMPLDITFDAWPEFTFQASITSLDTLINQESRNLKVRANLDNSDLLLRPGLLAQATLNLPEQPVLSVPTSSIYYRGAQAFVYTVVDNKAIETPVVTGQVKGSDTWIASGLNAGDTIIFSGISKVNNGLPVSSANDLTLNNSSNNRSNGYQKK